eukprot:746893_1
MDVQFSVKLTPLLLKHFTSCEKEFPPTSSYPSEHVMGQTVPTNTFWPAEQLEKMAKEIAGMGQNVKHETSVVLNCPVVESTAKHVGWWCISPSRNIFPKEQLSGSVILTSASRVMFSLVVPVEKMEQ